MADVKQSHISDVGVDGSPSRYMKMFEAFRDELDLHHDRRERIVKASRDITALSKKMIFSLQRAQGLKQEIPQHVAAENAGRMRTIMALFSSLCDDLQGINAWRYRPQISGGVQEFVEAISFEHYLTHQALISMSSASERFPAGVQLTEDDYLLGLFDLIGEVMRFAITAMATQGHLPGDGHRTGAESNADDSVRRRRNILVDLRHFRTMFESLDVSSVNVYGGIGREVNKKMGVMKECVEKVEKAAYGIMIRGRERPEGWMPDLHDEAAMSGQVEST